MCEHRSIHPARVDINATVCLDCGHQVHVSTFQYANGEPPDAQASKMWERCQEQMKLDLRKPEFKEGA